LQKKLIAITGRPGIGKTTLAQTIASELVNMGCSVGGFTTPELREGGVRRGFLVKSVDGLRSVPLASVTPAPQSLRVGRYYIDPGAEGKVLSILEDSIKSSDIIIIDEVGPMELSLRSLSQALTKLIMQPPKPLIVTFHYRLRDRSPELFSALTQGMLIRLDENNRNEYIRRAPELARWLASEACSNKGRKGAAVHT
jgi:nucleoside-triphosphatase